MRLILNADDFGASEETLRATIECFEAGALTSATIMVGMEQTEAAVEFARGHPEHGFGLHLRLVADGDARPLAGADAVPALVAEDGRFLPTRTIRLLALRGRLPVEQVEREIVAQLDALTGAGVPVTHLDSHRHVHKLPQVVEALKRALPRFGITKVRAVQDVYLKRPLTSPTYWVGKSWQRRLAAAFTTTSHMYMPSSAHDVGWAEPLLARCERFPGETLEVGVHPGFGSELWRDEERSSVLELAAAARAAGHELVTWRDV
jgi:predicted glycoside hydrolase/deacetylase ChbG (UPF0249 family)